jgi:hypothetical protein
VTKDQWGYVVWGTIATIVAIPELAAAFGREWVPWPSFARTVVNLQRRVPWLAMAVLAGFAILVVHIIFHPWPSRS